MKDYQINKLLEGKKELQSLPGIEPIPKKKNKIFSLIAWWKEQYKDWKMYREGAQFKAVKRLFDYGYKTQEIKEFLILLEEKFSTKGIDRPPHFTDVLKQHSALREEYRETENLCQSCGYFPYERLINGKCEWCRNEPPKIKKQFLKFFPQAFLTVKKTN